jgi:hypothetical protein
LVLEIEVKIYIINGRYVAKNHEQKVIMIHYAMMAVVGLCFSYYNAGLYSRGRGRGRGRGPGEGAGARGAQAMKRCINIPRYTYKKLHILFFIFFLLLATQCQCAPFTKAQWKSIRSILTNPQCKSTMRLQINEQIFNRYAGYAEMRANRFREKYIKGCRNVHKTDLAVYALKGLWISIVKYNASYPFYNHMSIYVESALYDGFSQLQPLTLLPVHLRRRNRMKKDWKYYNRLKPIFCGYDSAQIENTNYGDENLFYYRFWKGLEDDPLSKRMFAYKYDYELNKMRSNKEIAELLNCSDETVRLRLEKAKCVIQECLVQNRMEPSVTKLQG